MAGGGGNVPGQVTSEPNVIPMIDIMLVLLIIFMISQPLSRQVMEAQVPPPETAAVSKAQLAICFIDIANDDDTRTPGK